MNTTPSDIESQASSFFKFTKVGDLTSTIVDLLIIVAALAALIYLVLGGFQWITSGGDKTKTESAQKHITNAIIGLIVAVAAFAIFNFLKSFLGLDESIITK